MGVGWGIFKIRAKLCMD